MTKLIVNLGDTYKNTEIINNNTILVTRNFDDRQRVGIAEKVYKNDNGELIAEIKINDKLFKRIFGYQCHLCTITWNLGYQILECHQEKNKELILDKLLLCNVCIEKIELSIKSNNN